MQKQAGERFERKAGMGSFEPRNTRKTRKKTGLTAENAENTKKSGEYKPQMNSDGRRFGKPGGKILAALSEIDGF